MRRTFEMHWKDGTKNYIYGNTFEEAIKHPGAHSWRSPAELDHFEEVHPDRNDEQNSINFRLRH